MGCLVLLVIVVLIVTKAWWIILAFCLVAGLQAWHKASREAARANADRQRRYERTRRMHEVNRARNLATRQRKIAASDAALGLSSAGLAAANADVLEAAGQGQLSSVLPPAQWRGGVESMMRAANIAVASATGRVEGSS